MEVRASKPSATPQQNTETSARLPEITKNADALYARRHDVENVRRCLSLLATAPDQDFEISWRVSRCCFFLGQEESNDHLARAHHGKGIAAGERAVRLEPKNVAGHFWLGVNLALHARLSFAGRAAWMALRAKSALQHAIEMDPSYHGAGPLRVLGRLQSRMPGVLGGGARKALKCYEAALALAPTNTVTRLYLAELLLERGDTDSAREWLESIPKVVVEPEWSFEIERDCKLAVEMLSKLNWR